MLDMATLKVCVKALEAASDLKWQVLYVVIRMTCRTN